MKHRLELFQLFCGLLELAAELLARFEKLGVELPCCPDQRQKDEPVKVFEQGCKHAGATCEVLYRVLAGCGNHARKHFPNGYFKLLKDMKK